MGVFENTITGSSRIRRACAAYQHAAATHAPLSRSISRPLRFSASATQIFLDVYLQQSFEEAA
jgi:hypothetical protein